VRAGGSWPAPQVLHGCSLSLGSKKTGANTALQSTSITRVSSFLPQILSAERHVSCYPRMQTHVCNMAYQHHVSCLLCSACISLQPDGTNSAFTVSCHSAPTHLDGCSTDEHYADSAEAHHCTNACKQSRVDSTLLATVPTAALDGLDYECRSWI
jgi:hypothetical protein